MFALGFKGKQTQTFYLSELELILDQTPSLDIETVTNTIYKAIKDNSDITTKSKELVNKHYNIENTINKFSEIILENE